MYKKCLLKKFCVGFVFLSALVFLSGCEEDVAIEDAGKGAVSHSGCVYGVEAIHISGLTELKPEPEKTGGSQLKVYVDLLDSFGSCIKSPGKFRFELYEFVSRSGESRGKRIFIWPDIVLYDAAENNEYWHDHLRSYVFSLKTDFRVVDWRNYVLEATCLTGDGRRITDKFQLKAIK